MTKKPIRKAAGTSNSLHLAVTDKFTLRAEGAFGIVAAVIIAFLLFYGGVSALSDGKLIFAKQTTETQNME
jgi:hypothetical protein